MPGSDSVQQIYDPLMQRQRETFAAGFQNILLTRHPTELHLFLVRVCSQGVHMTTGVPDWVSRSGRRCMEAGLGDVGRYLEVHARREAGRDALYANDTRTLASIWNSHYPTKIDAAKQLSDPPGPSVARHQSLHEQTIQGNYSFAQLAIQHEMERVSTEYGPKLLGHIKTSAGDELVGGLSFLRDQRSLATQTLHSMMPLGALLSAKPDAAQHLARAGSEALATYLGYLNDCLAWGKAEFQRMLGK